MVWSWNCSKWKLLLGAATLTPQRDTFFVQLFWFLLTWFSILLLTVSRRGCGWAPQFAKVEEDTVKNRALSPMRCFSRFHLYLLEWFVWKLIYGEIFFRFFLIAVINIVFSRRKDTGLLINVSVFWKQNLVKLKRSKTFCFRIKLWISRHLKNSLFVAFCEVSHMHTAWPAQWLCSSSERQWNSRVNRVVVAM